MKIAAVVVAIAATAWSCKRRYQSNQSFGDWWNSEGLPTWIMVSILLFALLSSRF